LTRQESGRGWAPLGCRQRRRQRSRHLHEQRRRQWAVKARTSVNRKCMHLMYRVALKSPPLTCTQRAARGRVCGCSLPCLGAPAALLILQTIQVQYLPQSNGIHPTLLRSRAETVASKQASQEGVTGDGQHRCRSQMLQAGRQSALCCGQCFFWHSALRMGWASRPFLLEGTCGHPHPGRAAVWALARWPRRRTGCRADTWHMRSSAQPTAGKCLMPCVDS